MQQHGNHLNDGVKFAIDERAEREWFLYNMKNKLDLHLTADPG